MRTIPGRLGTLVVGLAAVLSACGGVGQSPATPAHTPTGTIGTTATSTVASADVSALAAAFPDQPFTGAQKALFLARWATDSIFALLQFDRPAPATAEIADAGFRPGGLRRRRPQRPGQRGGSGSLPSSCLPLPL